MFVGKQQNVAQSKHSFLLILRRDLTVARSLQLEVKFETKFKKIKNVYRIIYSQTNTYINLFYIYVQKTHITNSNAVSISL